MPDVRNEPRRAFRTRPERHAIFEKQHIIRPGKPLAPLPNDIWKRSEIAEERHTRTADGRGVIIRRFDNGDIQLCERPRDNPFERWDDSIPYACER